MRSEVREATRAQHENLERRLALSADTVSLDAYRRFLQMTSAVVIPLEPSLVDRLGDLFRVEGASRAERLSSDLHMLGLSRETAPRVALPNVASQADALGAGYVLQGSLLGGATIARLLQEHLDPRVSMSYLTLYGPDLGRVWQRFTTALDTFGVTAGPPDRARAVAAAVATFEAFDSALSALA